MDDSEDNPQQPPFYVNAKQYHRILKRRIARARLEEALSSSAGRKPYLHESRHKHAMRRPRGQGGRFLTASEIAELEKKKQQSEANGETPAGDDSDKKDDSPANSAESNDAQRSGESDDSQSANKIQENSNESGSGDLTNRGDRLDSLNLPEATA